MQHTTFLTFLGTPHFHTVCLILVSTAAIEALLAIWAATSRVHWFWRAFAVWAGIALLLPTRANQPALVFTFASPLTIAVISTIRSRKRPTATAAAGQSADSSPSRPRSDDPSPSRKTFRFGISDLLLITTIVGLFLTLFVNLLPRLSQLHAAEFTLTTIAQTTIPVLVWASFIPGRRRVCYLGLVAVVVTIAVAIQFVRPTISYDWSLVGILFESRWRLYDSQVAAIALSELALMLLVVIGLARRQFAPPVTSSHHLIARSALGIIAIVALFSLGLIYWHMLWLLPLPSPFSTEPTLYPRLLEICQQMRTIEKAGFPASAEPERQALIAEAITLAGAANYVPFYPLTDSSPQGWNNYIEPAQLVRNLARTIDSDAAAALARGDKDRACTLALTNVRLGLMLERGSTVVEYLIGIAVQGIANHRLIEIRNDLPPDQARRIVTVWQSTLREAEPIESVIARDRVMSERAFGWAARLGNIIDWAGVPSVYFSIQEAVLRREATARLLQTDLAIRLYQQEHNGSPPNRLDDLVPAYLEQQPIDAYSKQPLIYRPTSAEFILYSVGHDETDNGGKLGNMQTYYSRDAFENLKRGYDYDLDTTTRP